MVELTLTDHSFSFLARSIAVCLKLLSLTMLLLLQAPLLEAQALGATARCDATKVPAGIKVIGRNLRETPDLAPELQYINLMSNVDGCFEYSRSKLVEYQQKHPEDIGTSFLAARYLWRMGGIEQATELLERVVHEHPDFASGLVLLGAMNRERSSLTPARDYLKRALKISPDDLWANVNLLMLQAQMDENPAARTQLMEIAFAEQAPNFARQTATDFVLRGIDPLDAATGDQYERLLRLKLTYVEGHFREETLFDLAYLLVRLDRQAEARPLIEQLKLAPNLDPKDVAAMLAESYLRDALRIAPTVTPANAASVKLAREAVNDDFSRLAAFVALNPDLNQKLRPFIRTGKLDPNARDNFGRTLLCNAALKGELPTMQELIRAGADVNADCGGWSALGVVAKTGSADIETRKTMLSYLLANGADPAKAFGEGAGDFEYQCIDSPECRDNLLPIIKAHQAKAVSH